MKWARSSRWLCCVRSVSFLDLSIGGQMPDQSAVLFVFAYAFSPRFPCFVLLVHAMPCMWVRTGAGHPPSPPLVVRCL